MNEFEYSFPYERYEIWQLSVDLSVLIYGMTLKYPKEEKFGLINQMRRASTSVSANIAEGVCRLSEKEKARFMEVAYGSLMEVSNFMEISLRLKLINEDEYVKVRIDIKKLSNKLNAFHKILKMKK